MQKAARLSPASRLAALVRPFRPLRLIADHEREALVLATCGAAVFYMTALASFSPLDASGLSVSWPAQAPQNLAGTLGAHLSAAAVFSFGVIAWILPIPIVSSAFLYWRQDAKALARSRLAGWVLAITALAAAATLKMPTLAWHGIDLPSGGAVGDALADLVVLWFGRVGGTIALVTAIICATLLILRRSILSPLAGQLDKAWGACKRSLASTWEGLASMWPTGAAEGEAADSDDAERSEPSAAVVDAGPTIADFQSKVAAAPSFPVIAPAGLDAFPDEDEEGDEGESDESDEEGAETDADDSVEPVVPIHVLAKPQRMHSHFPAPSAPTIKYAPPPHSVFQVHETAGVPMSAKELETIGALLIKTFDDFGVQGKIIGYQPGPVVTVYEFQPDAGVKQSKVLSLIEDVALALKVDSIFIHPVRGKRALGIQVPNSRREPVFLGDVLGTAAFKEAPSPLTFGLGKTIAGQAMCTDLTAMPHLLVAGATGSGKSVCINAMLSSIIMKSGPEDVRMILVDPKMLELSIYEGIPHLLMPVITEPAKASLALKWAAAEMERRYKLMQLACVRNIAGFNEMWEKATPQRREELMGAVGVDRLEKLPYILLVIDELADLMMTAPKDVESSIQRLAQKARASGIHMVLATQRPSVDIITGVIKANLPCRIAFQVVSKHDSRTILDLIGAEKLLGKGDMLFQRPGAGRLERLQGALITDEEVINLVAAAKAQGEACYDESIISWIDDEYARQKEGKDGSGDMDIDMDDDPKFDEAVALARAHGVVSASFLQRHLKIGYNRAARIVEFMESKGMVDKADGAKPRKWLGPGRDVGLVPNF